MQTSQLSDENKKQANSYSTLDSKIHRADCSIIRNEMKVYPIMNRSKRVSLRRGESVAIIQRPY